MCNISKTMDVRHAGDQIDVRTAAWGSNSPLRRAGPGTRRFVPQGVRFTGAGNTSQSSRTTDELGNLISGTCFSSVGQSTGELDFAWVFLSSRRLIVASSSRIVSGLAAWVPRVSTAGQLNLNRIVGLQLGHSEDLGCFNVQTLHLSKSDQT